jgi:hypothetical protein
MSCLQNDGSLLALLGDEKQRASALSRFAPLASHREAHGYRVA